MSGIKGTSLLRSKFHLIVVIVMPLLVFIEPLIKGDVLFWGLPATQFIPWRNFALQELSKGFLPLWNPYNGLGAPLLANYQLAFFYPPGWIINAFWAIGGVEWMARGYLLVNVLHLSWAGLGTALFVRSLGSGRLGQVLSGLAFGLSAYFTGRIGTASMIWAGAWLPWLMLGATQISHWSENRKSQPPFLLLVAISFLLLAGHAQLAWYSLVLFGLWLIFLLTRKKSRAKFITGIGVAVVIMVLAIGMAALQLIPTAEYLSVSQRSNTIDYETGLTYSFWPWRLLTFLHPDYFGNPSEGTYFGYASYWEDAVYLGFIPLVLALSTIPVLFRKNSAMATQKSTLIFFWGANFTALLLALGKNTPLFPFLFQYIPTFDMFNGPTRFMIWAEFGIAALAGMAVSEWKIPGGAGLKRLRLLAAGAGAMALGAGLAWIALGNVRVTFISSTAMVGLMGLIYFILTLVQTKTRMRNGRWEVLVIAVVCIDLLINNIGKTPTTSADLYSKPIEKPTIGISERIFIDKQDEYLMKFSRFFRFADFRPIEDWINVREVLLPNANLFDQIPIVNNFDPLVPARFSEVMERLDQADDQQKIKLLQWINVGIYEVRDISQSLGVRFDKIEPWGEFRWANCVTFAANPQQALEKTLALISTADSGIPVSTVLETNMLDSAGFCNGTGTARITIIQELPQRTELLIHSDAAGYLVVARMNYPGWKATIDGENILLTPAEYLFYALPVLAGDHRVVLEYAPQSFYIGLVLTGLSIIIVIISVIFNRFHRRTRT